MKQEHKDLVTQIGVALFGVTGIALAFSPDLMHKLWSPVFGLLSQPFWFYMTIKKKLWGALFMTFLYTGAWSFGIYQNFFAGL